MSDLDKAREWAESLAAGPATDRAHAAARLIQSLPDQWIDAEKLREVVSKYEGNRYISEIVQDFADLLPAPKLPTLADMTQEEREACKWMQAKTWYEVGIIVWVDEDAEIAEIITQNNGTLERKFKDVTPLTGEPKLEWPGNKLAETPALPEGMRLADHDTYGRVVVSPKADEDGDYAVFESIPGGETGSGWGYVHKSELTFLGGGS